VTDDDDDDDDDDLTYFQTRMRHYRVLAVATSFPTHKQEKFEVLHAGVNEDSSLLGCYAVSTESPIFRRSVVPPS
jgi:hypothetical protein